MEETAETSNTGDNILFLENASADTIFKHYPYGTRWHMHIYIADCSSWVWQGKISNCSALSLKQPCELLFITSLFSPVYRCKKSLTYFTSPLPSTSHRPMREVMRTYSLLPMIWCLPTTFLIIFKTVVNPELIQPIPSLDRFKLIKEGSFLDDKPHSIHSASNRLALPVSLYKERIGKTHSTN